jgi:hypothetical protein
VYRELGGNFYDRLHPERTQNRLIRRLERLGLQVVVRPQTQTARAACPQTRARPPLQMLRTRNSLQTQALTNTRFRRNGPPAPLQGAIYFEARLANRAVNRQSEEAATPSHAVVSLPRGARFPSS